MKFYVPELICLDAIRVNIHKMASNFYKSQGKNDEA